MTTLIHERFLASARDRPNAVAIDMGAEQLSYEVCARWALALAEAIAQRMPSQARVAVALPKGPEAIITMLGCLMAGVAYVPIDLTAPLERQRQIAALGVDALVADAGTAARWSEAGIEPPTTILLHDLDGLKTHDTRDWRPPRAVECTDLAYVLSTSGSTGVPKGVAITHANAAHFVEWAIRRFELGPDDRLAVHAPLHFDLPVLDVYAGLGAGGVVCPIDERTVLFPSAVTRFLRERLISILYAVPSAYIALLDRGGIEPDDLALRLLLYAGEAFPVTSLARLVRLMPGVRVFNLYGPIETNVVTAHEVVAADLERDHVPIGMPIDGVDVLLRGDDGDLITRPAEVGEVCVAGPPVSPGYFEGGEIVPTRVELPSLDGPISCYPTGDYARWTADGELTLAGRRDGLVKTRGFRVEIGDVEAALARHHAVSQAAVFPVAGPRQTTLLHAAVVPHDGHRRLDAAELTAWCSGVLPAYMVPACIRVVDRLRYTTTGKVDRNALRTELAAEEGGMSATPPLVEHVAAIAAEVLGVASLETGADLFSVEGFSSLVIVELVEELERRLRLELDPALIVPEAFATPATLAELVARSAPVSAGGAR